MFSSTELYRRKGLTDHRLFPVTQIQKHSSKHSKSIRVFPRLVRFEAASDLGILDLIFRQDQAGISIFRSGCFIFFKNGFFSPLRTSMISSKVWSPSHWERFPAALVYGTDTATPCDAKTLSRVRTLAWWFRKMLAWKCVEKNLTFFAYCWIISVVCQRTCDLLIAWFQELGKWKDRNWELTMALRRPNSKDVHFFSFFKGLILMNPLLDIFLTVFWRFAILFARSFEPSLQEWSLHFWCLVSL